MPEGPELHLTSLFINRVCRGRLFSGKVGRNPIHKSAEIEWNEPTYSISSQSRGKELRLDLCVIPSNDRSKSKTSSKSLPKTLTIHFTFGMSGKFVFQPADLLQKHSHLNFFTKDEPRMALSFVDYRRFGRWTAGGTWAEDRGPCIVQEYNKFINHVASNLSNPAFSKPICEVMLNQKFFNGVGNYLRAEILYRCGVPPFERASSILRFDDIKTKQIKSTPDDSERTVILKVKEEDCKEHTKLQSIQDLSEKKGKKENRTERHLSTEIKTEDAKWQVKEETDSDNIFQTLTSKAQEVLQLCHTVALEVVQLGSTKYTLSDMYKDSSEDGGQSFNDWLQCYYQPGMKNIADHNNRTMWFTGPAGPLVPKDQKSRGKKAGKKSSKTTAEQQDAENDASQEEKKKEKVKGSLTRKRLKSLASKDKSKIQKTNGDNESIDVARKKAGRMSSQNRKNKKRTEEDTIEEQKKGQKRKLVSKEVASKIKDESSKKSRNETAELRFNSTEALNSKRRVTRSRMKNS